MFTSETTEAKPEGRQPWPAVVCGCRPVGREKNKNQDTLSQIRPSPGLSGCVCRDPSASFWSSGSHRLEETSEKSPIDFFCVFFVFFFPPPTLLNFLSAASAGGPPCSEPFQWCHSNSSGRVKTGCFKWKWGRNKPKNKKQKKSLQQLLFSLFHQRFFTATQLFVRNFGAFFFYVSHLKADASFTIDGDLEVEIKGRLVFSS